MKYLGGKFRIRKQIASYINNIRKQNQTYIEPFVGGGNIMMEIDTTKGENFAYDIHPGLITLYNSIKSGRTTTKQLNTKIPSTSTTINFMNGVY